MKDGVSSVVSILSAALVRSFVARALFFLPRSERLLERIGGNGGVGTLARLASSGSVSSLGL